MSTKRKTTIRDVAAAAGVSVTTVSDALSGKGRLPEETRRKVQSEAEKLGYRPSAIALGLRERGLGLVGLCITPAGEAILTDVGYWATIVTHASQTLLSEGLAPVLLPHSVDLLSTLKMPLDGAIVVDPLEGDPVLTFFERNRVRYITIGRDLARDNRSWLDDDNASGLLRLLQRTVPARTSVAFVTIGPLKSYVVDALNGANQWARDSDSSIRVFHAESSDDAEIGRVISSALGQGVGAIVAQHDRLALHLLSAMTERGIEAPRDVRLVSVTDSPGLESAPTPISAICQRPAQLAELTARGIIEMIRGKSDMEKTLLPLEIVVRKSAPSIFG